MVKKNAQQVRGVEATDNCALSASRALAGQVNIFMWCSGFNL